MTPSEELHQLIHSMNMSEKRYFKIYSSRHVIGGKNNYLQLFDAIQKQDKYDESKIKERFKGSTMVKHLPSEKNYLYQNVLESLNFYHKDKTFLAKYSNIFISVELLFTKGLFDQCLKLIRKAKKEAYALEKFSILNILLRWETLVYIKDEAESAIFRSFQEEIRVLDLIRTQSEFMRLAFRIQIQIDKGHVTKSFIRETENLVEQLYPKEESKRSFWIKYYYHSSRGLLFSIKNQTAERYTCYREIKRIMDESPQFIRDLPMIYHTNYNNLVNGMFLMKKYTVAEGLIRKQRLFLSIHGIKNPYAHKLNFINSAENELYLCYKTGRVKEGAKLVKQIEAEVKKVKPSFSPALYDLLFFMGVIDYLAGNYNASIRWLNRILNAQNSIYFRKELELNTRLLYLIVLHDSDDWLFENRFASTKKIISQEHSFKLQHVILDALKVVLDSNMKNKKDELQGLMKLIRKEQKSSNEELINKTFDFLEWIEFRSGLKSAKK